MAQVTVIMPPSKRNVIKSARLYMEHSGTTTQQTVEGSSIYRSLPGVRRSPEALGTMIPRKQIP